jgi:hypothetical protein
VYFAQNYFFSYIYWISSAGGGGGLHQKWLHH